MGARGRARGHRGDGALPGRSRDRARSWLYRIATNTAYDYLRRERRAGFIPLADQPGWLEHTSDLAARASDSAPIWAALNQLPISYRVPLMYRGMGYEIKDIAAVLGSSVTAMKARIHRARERFRQFYGTEAHVAATVESSSLCCRL